MRNPNGSSREAPVTVTFPIPRRAASKLRTMAVSRDRRLLNLGVLAVQINEGESIVLGIKLGKQKIKKTEDSWEKVRGNARRGRVKKPSTCRNVATIHHMPNGSSSKLAHNLKAAQTAEFSSESGEEERNGVAQLDGELLGSNLLDHSSKTVGKASNNSNKFRVSDFTTSFLSSGVSLNGESCPAKLSAHQTDKPQNNNNFTLGESVISQGSNGHHTIEISSLSPAMIKSRTASDESYLSAVQILSSPSSHRAYSASPSSDSSSSSSEENADVQHDQLIFSCFVDRSRYSAADMLKELAKTHVAKKVTTGSPVENTAPLSVNTTASGGSNPTSSGNALSLSSGVSVEKRRSNIPGSYREHVKNIRCNSLTSLTPSTSTVNSTLKLPSVDIDQTLGRGTEKPDFGVGIQHGLTQHNSHHITLSKPSMSQTKSMKINTSKTPTYHGGRKVLWSSSNAFPRSTISSPHFPVNTSSDSFPELNSSSSRNVASLSQVQETTAIASCVKSTEITYSDTSKLTATTTASTNYKANKLFQQELVNETSATLDSSKTVSAGVPLVFLDSQVSVSVTNTSPCATTSASSTYIPEATREGSCNKVVQDLAMVQANLPAPVVVAGTNTQTTWSSQQVSPTYFVGTQGQYGIYSALYSPDGSNKELGQQALAAAYPLNYVYPISFVYPYLAMAQASNVKSLQSEKCEKQKRDGEVTQLDTFADRSKTAKAESSVDAKESIGTTVTSQVTSSSAVPVQTQFIDLTSSMRYWQQFSLLYRSRLQELASGNLSNISATSSSIVSTTGATSSTNTGKSHESLVMVVDSEASLKLNSAQLSLPKSEPFQASSSSQDVYQETTKTSAFSQDSSSRSRLSHHIKPDISLEKDNGLRDKDTTDRPSVIVAASCKGNWDYGTEIQRSPVKLQCKQEIDDSKTKSSEPVLYQTSSENEVHSASLQHDQLRQFDNDDNAPAEFTPEFMPEGLKKRFYGSPPKLSFIHDSSIACVNVGNSNGFGSSCGTYTGARKTGM